MRKFIVFADGDCCELSPITYEEFVKLDHWIGNSDTSWMYFRLHNRVHELESFDNKVFDKAHIELLAGEPDIDWSIVYGSEHTLCWRGKCDRCLYRRLKWADVSRGQTIITPGDT